MKFISQILQILLNFLFIKKDVPMAATKSPAAVPLSPDPQSTKDVFKEIALPLVLIFEGGFSDDPADRGGRTNHGIIQREYDSYRQEKGLNLSDVKDISDEEIQDIYFNKYWKPSRCDLMPEKLATVVFDTSVNCGQRRSVKTLQKAIGANPDGIIGPETVSKLKNLNQEVISNSFLDNKELFYKAIVEKDSTQQKFLGGWLRRVQFVRDFINNKKTLDEIKQTW